MAADDGDARRRRSIILDKGGVSELELTLREGVSADPETQEQDWRLPEDATVYHSDAVERVEIVHEDPTCSSLQQSEGEVEESTLSELEHYRRRCSECRTDRECRQTSTLLENLAAESEDEGGAPSA